ncbi:MAG: ATP-dependent helicase [Candidatus Nanopelagicales bacterium]|nr:ATP-dependent helicase [Candidatus Nanopelagicales bacterium]
MTLTAEQRVAVETEATEAIVIAGAGSGKTRVLVARILWLLGRGASPSEIMTLTFTRKAAGEMRRRICDALREDGHRQPTRIAGRLLMGTFHAVALELLRSHGDAIGYEPASLTIVDEADANLLLEEACESLGLLRRSGTWKSGLSWSRVAQARERYYQTGVVAVDRGAASAGDGEIRTALHHYHAELRSMNALDFGLILLEANRLMGVPAIRAIWQSRIRHVLVDEAQDCDTTQYVLHDQFSPPATFFAAGDARQCVYGWRGARPDLLVTRRAHAAVFHLNACFRSGVRIVVAANQVIAANCEPMTEPMHAVRETAGAIAALCGRSADVALAIQSAGQRHLNLDGKPGWSRIAVLARKHDILVKLGERLAELSVPFHRVGSMFDVCGTEEFRVVYAALRAAVNPRDGLALRRLLRAFHRTLGEDDQSAHFVGAEAGTILRHGAEACTRNGTTATCRTARLVCWLRERLGQAVSDILPDLDEHLPGVATDYAAAFIYWHDQCAEFTVVEALRWFALRDVQDDVRPGNHVTLATIHAAKGLEWEHVFAVDWNEGVLPSGLSLREPDGVRDERRVAYVALTRAKDRLDLHWRRPADQDHHYKTKAPSRFLYESGVVAAD